MYNPILYQFMKVQNSDHKLIQEAIAKRNKDEQFKKDLRIHGFSKIVSYISVVFLAYIFIIEQLGVNDEINGFLKLLKFLEQLKIFAIIAAAMSTIVRFNYAKKMQEHYKIINQDFYNLSIKHKRMSFPLVSASAKEIILSYDGVDFNLPSDLILNKDDYMSGVELDYEQYLMPVFRVTPKNKLKFTGFRLGTNYDKKQI